MLYGIVGALFSYCVSLAVASPLAAFAVSAGYQVIMFIVSHLGISCITDRCCSSLLQLYLAAFLLTLTYAKTSADDYDLKLIRKCSYDVYPSSLLTLYRLHYGYRVTGCQYRACCTIPDVCVLLTLLTTRAAASGVRICQPIFAPMRRQ